MPSNPHRYPRRLLALMGLLAGGSALAQTPTFTMMVNPATVPVCSNQLGSTWVRLAGANNFSNSVFLQAFPVSGPNYRVDGFTINPVTPFGLNPVESWMRVLFFPNAAGPVNITIQGQELGVPNPITRTGIGRFFVTLTPTPFLQTRVLSPKPAGVNTTTDPEPTDIGWHPLFSWANIGLDYTAILREGAVATPLETKVTSNTSLRFDEVLEPDTDYTLSVQGFNHCGFASTGAVEITTAQACFLVDQPIPDGAGMLINSGLIAGNVAENLRVTLSIEHPRVSDLRVSLMRLDRSGILIDQPGLPGSGCNRAGLEAVLRDSAPRGAETECANEGPAVNGQLRPNQPLSAFEGVAASGEWTLVVEDLAGGQAGRLYEWCLSSGNAPGDVGFQADGLMDNGFE